MAAVTVAAAMVVVVAEANLARRLSILAGVAILALFLGKQRYLLTIFFSDKPHSQCSEPEKQRLAVWSACGVLKSQNKKQLGSMNESYEKINVSYSSLIQSYLYRPNFSNAKISDSNFENINLWHGTFKAAQILGTNIAQSTFIEVDFSNSELVGNLVENSRFLNANFSSSRLQGSRFINCDFENSNFQSADLENVTFLLSSLKGATYNSATKLPFSKDIAQSMGMIYVQ